MENLKKEALLYLKRCYRNANLIYQQTINRLYQEYEDYLNHPNRTDNIKRTKCNVAMRFINEERQYNFNKLVSYYERKALRDFKAISNQHIDFFPYQKDNNKIVYIPILKEILVSVFNNNPNIEFFYGEDLAYSNVNIQQMENLVNKSHR